MPNFTIYIRKKNAGKWKALGKDPAKWVNDQLAQSDIRPLSEVKVNGQTP